MRNLEPKIFRQRLVIEAVYGSDINEGLIKKFLNEFASCLKMNPITEPFIFTPNDLKHPLHHGIAGFMGWAESGCSIYTWDKFNFLTVDIYACKKFDIKKAVHFVKQFFKCKDIDSEEFRYG
jgi:S-adenosylmethionine decarboxylase